MCIEECGTDDGRHPRLGSTAQFLNEIRPDAEVAVEDKE
jgi:hypothetical protein